MVDEVKLAVDIRKDFSGSRLNELRNEGKIPAVVYGPDIESDAIILDAKEFKESILHKHGENTLIKLKVGSKKAVSTLIKEIQLNPITNKIIHVDFCQINLTETIEVEVPLEAEGDAPGVKNEGGVLEHIVRNIRVKCLPAEIPGEFVVDVSGLNIGDSLKIKDITKVEGVEMLDDEETIIIHIGASSEIKEVEEEAEESAEPEIVGKKAEEAPEEPENA